MDEGGMTPVALTIISPRKEYCYRARNITSDLLFSSPNCNRLSYRGFAGERNNAEKITACDKLYGSVSAGLPTVVFSSTGRRPASYCHGVGTSCVRPSVRSSVRASVNLFFKKLLLRNY